MYQTNKQKKCENRRVKWDELPPTPGVTDGVALKHALRACELI